MSAGWWIVAGVILIVAGASWQQQGIAFILVLAGIAGVYWGAVKLQERGYEAGYREAAKRAIKLPRARPRSAHG